MRAALLDANFGMIQIYCNWYGFDLHLHKRYMTSPHIVQQNRTETSTSCPNSQVTVYRSY
jgi:hypothetical protein